jgi:hypothetical protein
MHGKGIYTTPDKDIALKYAKNNPESKVYELYINSNKPQNKTVIKDFYDFKKKDKELRDLYSKTEDDILKKNIAQEHKKLGDDWGIKYSEDLKNQDLKKEFDYLRVGDNQVTPFSNYPKSAIGNNGMFDMTNPNIYKSILPAATGLGAASQLDKKQNGGLLQYDNGGYTDLIKYDGATHDNSPIDGIPIAANGQQLNSGFSNNIPPATKALVEDGEYYIKDKNYVITNNDKLKPTKDMSFLNPKKTFAKNLTTIKNKYKGRENDPITETSYKREENRLIEANETMRLAKEAKTNPNPLMMAKNGGKLPKYFNGGTVPEVTPNYPLVGPLDNSWKTNMFGSNYKVPNIEEEIITGEQDISPITAFGSEKALKRQTGYSYKDGILGKQTDNNPFKMTTGDKLQLGAGALSGITNLAMGMKKPEEYPTLTSPYFGAGLNDMNQNVRFNTNPILMNRNVGMNQINQGSTSDGVRRANLQSLTSNTNRALGELAEKEALANVGIKQSLGQAKIGVGQQDLAARMDSQNKNIASKAIAQNLRAKGLEQIYGSVSDTGKGMNQSRTNTIQLNVLNSLAAQYGLDPKKLEIIFKQQGITTTK